MKKIQICAQNKNQSINKSTKNTHHMISSINNKIKPVNILKINTIYYSYIPYKPNNQSK